MLNVTTQIDMELNTVIPVAEVEVEENVEPALEPLLVANELRAHFNHDVRQYIELHFIAKKHMNRMDYLRGFTSFKDGLYQAPEFIFRNIMEKELTRLSTGYQGVTDNVIRFDELACRLSAISDVDWPNEKGCQSQNIAKIAIDKALASVKWELLAVEVNTKAQGLETQGKQKSADSLIHELELTRYKEEVTSNVKITKRHVMCIKRVYRYMYDTDLEPSTKSSLHALHKHLQLVAIDTEDRTLLRALDEMKVDEYSNYTGEAGCIYGDKAQSHIKMHKESMKLSFTHDSFEQLMVWIMSYASKEIATLPNMP